MNTLSQSGPSTLDSSPTRNLLNSFRDRIQRNGSISSPFRPANSASDAINSELLESPVHDEVATTLNDMNSHIPDDVEETVEVDEFLMSRYDDFINNNENNSEDNDSSVDDIDSEDLSDDILAKANLSTDELSRLRIFELKEICRAYKRPVSGNKNILVARVKQGPVIDIQYQLEGSVMDEIVKCWMMKPLKKTDAMKIGITNESQVFKHLVNHLEMSIPDINDTTIDIIHKPMTFGLVCDKSMPWLATSVDGLIVLSIKNNEK